MQIYNLTTMLIVGNTQTACLTKHFLLVTTSTTINISVGFDISTPYSLVRSATGSTHSININIENLYC